MQHIDKSSDNFKEHQFKEHRKEPNSIDSKTKKTLLITIAVAAALIIGLWIWKSVQIGNIKDNATSEQQQLKEQAVRRVVQSHETHLKLLAKPYVWAVRSELMRGNINQVNLFANDMVKQKNMQRIVVANDKGIIVSSTNKKDEGALFSTIGSDVALNHDSTSVENVNDSVLVMTSPIMGFNNRLGTLLIRYTIPPVGIE